jgi:hypothetical protein
LPQPNQQQKNKTKQFGWSGIIIGKKTTTPPTQCDYILSHFQATYEADFCYAALF